MKSLSNIKQNRTSSLSNTKSFSKSYKGIKLYNFSQIESYGKIKRPLISETKKQYLKTKLDIDKTAENRTKERFRLNQLYVPFNENPFSLTQGHSKSAVTIQTARPQNSLNATVSNRNILVQINKIKDKEKIHRKKQNILLVKNQQNAQRISNQLQQQVKQSIKFSPIQPFKLKKNPKIQLDAPLFQESTISFQEIVRITDYNYYRRKNQSIDIFKEMYNSDNNLVSRRILDKYYFSFTTITQKKNIKVGADVERDISRQARNLIRRKPAEKDNLDTFDTSDLNFNDILHVAAGRFTPEYVYGFKNSNKKRQDKGSSINSDDIIYGDDSATIGCTINNDAQGHQQVQQFFNLNLTPKQSLYMKTCINRKSYVENHLQIEEDLLKRQIYDQRQHLAIKNKITQGLKRFIEADFIYPPKNTERDRVVSKNKEGKDKTQNIKLYKFSQTIALRNQQNERIKQLIKKRL